MKDWLIKTNWIAKMRGSVALLAVIGVVLWLLEWLAPPGFLGSVLGFIWSLFMGLVCIVAVLCLCVTEGMLYFRGIQASDQKIPAKFNSISTSLRVWRFLIWVAGLILFLMSWVFSSSTLRNCAYGVFVLMGVLILVALSKLDDRHQGTLSQMTNNIFTTDALRNVFYQNKTFLENYINLSGMSLFLTLVFVCRLVLSLMLYLLGPFALFVLKIVLLVAMAWSVFLLVQNYLDSKKTIKVIKGLTLNQELAQDYTQAFLQADKIRADITAYSPGILSDANRGSWELWDMAGALRVDKASFVRFTTPLIARNPKADIIKEGLVGIDFGTTSTVVVYQEGNGAMRPMRIGLGDISAKVSKHQYENPTIISFNDLTSFLESYKFYEGRPRTKWKDVQVSHTAYSAFLGSPSSEYNAYLSELKQWAGSQHEKLQILDKQKAHFEVKGALDLVGDDLNPIEIYAYYLGLYINNQHRGIFLDYLLSFPVTYEPEVRAMILKSFKKGLAKSLPNTLHSQGIAGKLKIEEGAGEPAAYAIMALEGYGFEPSENERIYYGVFDFGGGTTDFDFGLFLKAPESSRYDYILEHFGAGGDRYLGGENLLELASFEIFKRNKDLLFEKQIPFKKAAEGNVFLGGEILINRSQEACTNTKTLVEKLRPLWEGRSFEDEGELSLNLFNCDGQQIAGMSLDFNMTEVLNLFKQRIKYGIENFFEQFFIATNSYFEKKQDEAMDIGTFHIFLAGNASKSAFVENLFNEKIASIQTEFDEPINFILHKPLASTDLEKPNGKTGVAFGLLKARKGGSIQVINTYAQESTHFKYFLGRIRKQKFEILINRDQAYHKWVQFIDASESHFDVYYTAQANAYNLSPTDPSIKKKSLETDITDANAFIFVRLVDPNTFEFVVATQEGIANEKYLNRCKRVKL
ncbi:molecular chaperone DnaK [Helicobacter suis]|uniref:molecular chaperone DnaK n=1 Tax=Helicobacter suis TaxID=104628 RepID=UPI001F076C3E|nr:molecular chaperone DnaK [Helicobacter suis]